MCCCVNFQVSSGAASYSTYKLSEQESGDQEQTRALHERPATGTGDEDQSLAHNTNLEIQCRHHLMLAVPDWPHTEFILRNGTIVRKKLSDMNVHTE